MSTISDEHQVDADDLDREQDGPGLDDREVEGEQDALEVHRDGPLSLLVGATAGVLAVAFLLRGVGAGGVLDWELCAVTGVVAAMHLAAVVDARAPLLVLDRYGVRVRRGAAWQGLAWSEVDHVEHRARTTTLRDGSLTVVARDGRRLGVRLSLSTRLVGADWHEVDEALAELSGGAVPIEGTPESAVEGAVEATGQSHAEAGSDHDAAELPVAPVAEHPAEDPAEHPETPEPEVEAAVLPTTQVTALRASRPALRSELTLERRIDPDGEESELPIAAETETETIVIDTAAVRGGEASEQVAAVEPVIGRTLSSARARIGISVEALAERTRIRPHVIEAIEVDDFDPCGGDFYARGHLRTLSRVLGVESTELLATYDELYAHAPIDARRVFEAELAGAQATSASGRSSRGGLNWSVLVAAVMAVVLVWSVARLVMDGPVPLTDQPVLNGSPGGKATLSGATTKVPVSLTAATGGARVIVRDARQQVVFDAELAFMQTAELTAAPPVRISTTDGGLLVSVDGVDEGAIGATGQDAQRTYVP